MLKEVTIYIGKTPTGWCAGSEEYPGCLATDTYFSQCFDRMINALKSHIRLIEEDEGNKVRIKYHGIKDIHGNSTEEIVYKVNFEIEKI